MSQPESVEQRLAALQEQIKKLEQMANKVNNTVNAIKRGNDPTQQQQQRQPREKKEKPVAQQTTTADANAKKPSVKPQNAGAKPAYQFNMERAVTTYKHEVDLPQNMICDPTINYKNALTNTDEDIANAYNENEKKFRQFAKEQNLKSVILYRAPGDYYDWTLQKRRDLLGASSVHYLCKSMLMKNSKCPHDNFDNKLDSKYYFCVIQYTARLHNEKVAHSIRRLYDEKTRPSLKNFNFRWTDPDVSFEMTGHPHNGVTPLMCKSKVPVILSHKIAELPLQYFWFGAGEVDLKIRMSVGEFVAHFAENIIIDDITYDEPVHDDNGPIEPKA